jgi:hypothetical protein
LSQRPISVTGVACLFMAAGAAMFLFHLPELLHPHWDTFLVESVELIGLAAGIFMLKGRNWARWLALAWIAFHVAITAIPPFHGLVVHALIFAGITWILLRSDSAEYFRGSGTRHP